MDAAWFGDERPVVGVVDSETETERELVAGVEPTVDAADGSVVAGDVESVLAGEPTLLVAAGESTLSAVGRTRPDVPVLPVGDVAGIDTVDREALPSALEAVLEGDATVRQHPILDVDVERGGERPDDVRALAAFDVTLVTGEPARISEYGVSSRGESVATFRADGVVVATPAGTHGYASALEAPHLSPAVDAVAVAPIAPFVTRTRRWVLPDDEIALTVERDEGDVTLVADDRPVGSVTVGARVAIGVAGTFSTLSVPTAVCGSD